MASTSASAEAWELSVLLEKEHIANLSLTPQHFAFTTSHIHSSFATAAFSFGAPKRPIVRRFTYANVLNATFDPASNGLCIRLLSEESRTRLPFINATVPPEHALEAEAWIQELMRRSYGSVQPYKRLKVLLNPISGKGKGKESWEGRIRPLLAAAGTTVDFEETKYSGHAKEIARSLDLKAFDAIVVVSGDGLAHEIINGLALRDDAEQALKTPLGLFPCGSGNALCVNIAGPEKYASLANAALHIIKGQPMPMDLMRVTQGDSIYYSFLSTAFGLIADSDIGTDNWRWMGPIRFTLGYVAGVMSGRFYPAEISMQIVEQDKESILAKAKSRSATADSDGAVSTVLPKAEEQEWTTYPQSEISFFYAGTLPYVASDLKAFPAAGSDGLIDVAIMKKTSKGALLQAMDGADKGSHVQHVDMDYFKVSAFRLAPSTASQNKYLAVDGESVPVKALQVSVVKSACRVLSLDQTWHR